MENKELGVACASCNGLELVNRCAACNGAGIDHKKTLVKALREVAALREELARTHTSYAEGQQVERDKWQQRLTAAEQRNARYARALERVLDEGGRLPMGLAVAIRDELKPTESSPAQVALSQNNQRIVPVEPMISQTAYDGFDNGSD